MRAGIHISATPDAAGQRADVFLSEQTGMTRSHIAKLIKDGRITAGGQAVKAKQQVKPGDDFEIIIPEPVQSGVQPQDIPIDIIYQDEHLAVVNKPRGLVVHPAPGNEDNTLVNALLHSLDNLSGINGEIRPGIVHRLDKDTTGLLVVAKNDSSHLALSQAIQNRQVRREYLALVQGNFAEDTGTVNAPIGRSRADRKRMAVTVDGREAVTDWAVEERYGEYTLLRCSLRTGRTHQIRVHMAHINHPVIGDPDYGPRRARAKAKGQLLHSTRLSFIHPITGEAMDFVCEPPEDFLKALRGLDEQI